MERTDRATKVLLLVLAAGVWALALRGTTGRSEARAQQEQEYRESFDEIEVKRINVVEEDGTLRVVIANTTRFPKPIIDGKEYPRSVSPAGLVFYDGRGSECGGIGLTDVQDGSRAHLVFDYHRSEAVAIGRFESLDGKHTDAGISIVDPTPATQSLLQGTVGHERISISGANRDARIVLSDPQGRPRIRLAVDSRGEPSIEVLDERGQPVLRLPETR
jgi:hypothetical protein